MKYEVISRVVDEKTKEVIGFMMQPLKHGAKEMYMSIEVLSFGLLNKNFLVKDVIVSSNGKPRGTNGFLLSKLPILLQSNKENVNKGIVKVLIYVVKHFCEKDLLEMDIKLEILNNSSIGSIKIYLESFVNMDKKSGNKELSESLNFYLTHLPKELENCCDSLLGVLNDKGVATISAIKKLV